MKTGIKISKARWFAGCCILMLFGCMLLAKAQAMVLSQDEYLYRVWSVESGLPQISVTAIAQDSQGFIWLGTQNGLARFDGVHFDVFNTANTPAFSSNLITALYIDRQHRIWIGTVNGLMRYQQGQFTRVDKQPLQGNVTGIAELPDGTIYIGAEQLYQWRESQQELLPLAEHKGAVFQLFQQQDTLWIGGQNGFGVLTTAGYQWHSAPQDIAGLQITELAKQDNDLYLGTNLGLYRWQHGQWQAMPLPQQPDETRIEMLYLDPQQKLWVASYEKLYTVQQGQLLPADRIQGPVESFSWVESMLKDRHGNIWLGSHSHGLKRLRRPPTQRFSKEQGIADPYVWAVQPWQQHLLAGTSGGLSLLQHGQFQPLMANQYLPSIFVYSMLLDSKQRLWVGTRAGLSRLDGKNLAWQRNYADISHLLVTTLVEEGDRIWVGTNGGLYYLQDDELSQQQVPEALRAAKIRIVLPDNQQRLWVGTENGLFLRDSNSFVQVEDMPLSGRFISMVTQFADGNILIGSFDQGFVLGQPGNWRWFTQLQGLPGNGVMHAELIENQLLISNFQGFYRLNYPALQHGNVEQLYMLVDDRRPDAETDAHRCCNGAGSSKGALHQGRLWYPTLNGVLSLPLQQLIQHAPIPEPVIRDLSAGTERFSDNRVSLIPEQRDWHLRFTAPYYVFPSSLQFRYQLQGYDNNWIDAGTRREAFYTNLPPGHYTFNVQVRLAADYRWSDTVAMQVELQPYWYETTWARALALLTLLLAVWGLYRWRLRTMAKAQEHLAQLVTERTQELHEANEKLQTMSMQDALTGLHNRHYLNSNIPQILARSERHGQPLIWLLLDLDHFKQINDSFGHQTGDAVLTTVAGLLQQNSRSVDHLIRWGGEEFLLLLEQSDDALRAIQRIHNAIAAYAWQDKLALTQPLSCSIGAVAQLPGYSWQHCLRLADQALYWVKEHGRDGYMLVQPLSADISLTDAENLSDLLSQGKLHVVSNKDFTVEQS